MKLLMRTLDAVRGAYSGKFAIMANTVTSGGLGLVGDVLAQKFEQGADFTWDAKRTRNMALVCSLAGPIMHVWYRFLDGRIPGHSMRAVTTKVGLDLLTGPFWYGWYIGGLSVLRGDTKEQTIKEFKAKVPIVIAVDLSLWPIFQGMNFAFFPPHYRILVLKCNELVLDVIFSHVANNDYTFSSLLRAIRAKIKGNSD